MKYIAGVIILLVVSWLWFYLDSLYSRSELEQKLVANFQANTFIKLDSLIKEKDGLVCLIGEYANGVQNINNETARLNAYLKKINFSNGEDDTALAIVTKDKIHLFEFDNKAWNIKLAFIHRGYKGVELPTNFEPARQDCMALKDAYFYQTIVKYDSLYPFTSNEGVKYITFGSKK